jgi:PAS domain S-box-containing protein
VRLAANAPPLNFLAGGGATGDLIRQHDWRATPLGDPLLWPQPLKTIVSVMLAANQPMFAAWGREQTIIYNDGYARIMGNKHPAGLGCAFGEVWHEIADDVLPIMARGYAGEPTAMDHIALQMERNGEPEEAHFSFFYTPLRDERGEVGGVFCACNEITAQVNAGRQRSEQLDRLWSNSQDLLAVLGADGYFRAANPAWHTVLGLAPDEVVGRHVDELIHPEDRQATRDALAYATHEALLKFENRYRHKEGGFRWISWAAGPDAQGVVYANGRHITAERDAMAALAKAEEALRQSQKMEAVGQLTGGIAHDFNNLLQGITGSLELVKRRVAQGRTEELQRFIDGAMNSARRASSLTHRLLAFSRRQPLDPKPVRAHALIASMEDLLRRTLGERIQLEFVMGGGLWLTLCDPNQLESALLNLAINARDAMPGGGRLTVETANAHLDAAYTEQQVDLKPGQYVCISVSDTGSGMPDDVVERAFEPFFTTKPLGEGTGLGLSMIYGFAHQSEGHVKIYSEVQRGTTVRLYLPRHHERGDAEVAECIAAEARPAPAAALGESVLVIEDEPVVRGLIVDVLNELGYRTLEAADGPSGLKWLQSNETIDLLVTDIGLPGLNGRQVADAAREPRPGLKVLFMTGYAENAALAAGFLEPGMALITKPFAMDALANRVREMLEDSAPPPAPEEPAMTLTRTEASHDSGIHALRTSDTARSTWWPAELGGPSGSGSHNGARYAWFPALHRLAIDDGTLTVYDTQDHQIASLSQQASREHALAFNSQRGTVNVADLPVVSRTRRGG